MTRGEEYDRPMHPCGAELTAQAFDQFAGWLERQPERIKRAHPIEQARLYDAAMRPNVPEFNQG